MHVNENITRSQTDHLGTVNRAFSKQSSHFDAEDDANIILRDMRLQIYHHVDEFLPVPSYILELNAGTGIDAFRFANAGHRVHATDLSTGMIDEIVRKTTAAPGRERVTSQQVSYDNLDRITDARFDYVFSNFGGLNCIKDLSRVTKHLPALLNQNAYVTFVIMPPVCIWELLWIFKGQFKQAFRRLKKDGVLAHLEGEYFKTYYHSLSAIKKSFPYGFKFIRSEGLGALSPTPGSTKFVTQHPSAYAALRKADTLFRNSFPFNQWADHIIVTFQYINQNR
ncbi:MAG: class I SAM-dependent methyltransferase [Chryseolinea sp.]